jgi:pimeloyl-ACP methyl ester carboxylesterase
LYAVFVPSPTFAHLLFACSLYNARMPFARVSDLQMFYNEYGPPDAPPLLLIHGSGGTGASEWRPVLEGLAEHFRVIAADCRGHGKTLDPRRAYSFDLLANDMSELLRVLNIAPAFVAGHSNGGNVALVLTLEHPETVKKAVVMAGNAYVSDDLRRYENGRWSERISIEWGKQLGELHDAVRFPGYWRELMDRTGWEISRAPNYSTGDLEKCKTPVLVIQGANDPVNAPSHHAESLAENLGDGQLWLVPETGHSVHEEHPKEWVERVTRFFLE